ncbi:MAG: MNIO family bufferin maturase [Gammaproteobacteria bacterium]
MGLRAPHFRDVLNQRPSVGWLEVHSENYFGDGGLPLYYLTKIRADYPISLHGVGLSLGSTDPLSKRHLAKLARLIGRIEPGVVSEHLAWSSIDDRYLNDLLPLPYTDEALVHVVERVQQAQEILGRRILIENVSSYLEYSVSTIPEWEFIVEVAKRSGCGLLIDVNNLYVAACNHGFDPLEYLRHIPARLVDEIHLAGYTVKQFDDATLLIDTHNQPVSAEVWALYAGAIGRFGPKPTLIEWDTDLPALAALLAEANKAQRFLEVDHAIAA